jgi:uncharacterized protein YodC (DUF2158 family)
MLHVSGVVKGCRKVDSVDKKTGEVRTKWYIGFASQKENGYDDDEVVTDVQVSKNLYEAGLVAYYEKFKGQEVIAPVFFTTFSPKDSDRVYVNIFFSGDGKALPAPKAAAVAVGAIKQ